ncbi:MAG TPA: TonB-dependent receptor [Candidatus Tumulicola sp.]|nr:TonB-dependent receptor [Candidatus Tumulicola sp.]
MPKSLIRALSVAAFVFAFVFGQATGTLASTNLGGLSGTVTNTSGQPVADVSVTAVSPSSTAKATTGSNGFYAMAGLAPDTYVLTFSKSGYVTQPIPGVTVTQDQTVTVNARLQTQLTTIGKVTVRGQTSLVQPSDTADKYTVTPQNIMNITGTPQNISETAVLNSLPGITTDNAGYPIIRGGAENDEGYQLEGIDATEPVTGQFINSLSLAGVSRLVVSTGGYDVSAGNTNSGVVNEVIRRGAYPGSGLTTALVNAPNFDHRFAFEYGNGSADQRFSYYYAFSGLRQYRVAGDTRTFLPRTVGGVGDAAGNENVLNLFYRWGKDNRNEIQYLGENGANLFDENYNELQYGGTATAICQSPLVPWYTPGPLAGGTRPACLPYASNNTAVQINLDFLISAGVLGVNAPLGSGAFLPNFPGQTSVVQPTGGVGGGFQNIENIGWPDNENNQHFIQKIAYKRQFNSSSFGQLRLFRTNIYDHFLLPWDGGAFGDFVQQVEANNLGIGADFQTQLSSHHELALGAETIYSTTHSVFGNISFAPVVEPLLVRGCVLSALFGVPQGTTAIALAPGLLTGQCYIGPFNAALNNLVGAGLPTGGPNAPLSVFPTTVAMVNDPVHRSDLYLRDRWTPSDKFTIVAGVRWDQEILEIPKDAAAQSTGYVVDNSGNVVEIPGLPIGNDVTRPSQVSPRLAITYQLNARNVFRASAGTNIEFTPEANIENKYQIDPAAFACTIASGCYLPLPGFGTTNSIGNLGRQIIVDLNANNFAQYTPVKPQRAFNADFSVEHDFGGGLEMRITPYYRRGTDYVVANTPVVGTLLDGTPIFGAPREENAGENRNFGVEFSLIKNVPYGFSGFLNATYDNTLANYNSDFFPSVNNAALALHHFFHVSYLAPITATGGLTYYDRRGMYATLELPYESGYRYGVGKKTFVFANCSDVAGCTGVPTSLVPVEVLNTDLASTSLGQNSNTSAYYFTDPANPGTILHPNITGSRGTPDGDDPGTLRGPQRLFVNLTLAHEVGNGPNKMTVGVRGSNLLGNYTNGVVAGNSRYRNNGLGGFSGTSGTNAVNPLQQPLQFPRSPLPFENEATGPARLFTFFVSSKF